MRFFRVDAQQNKSGHRPFEAKDGFAEILVLGQEQPSLLLRPSESFVSVTPEAISAI
jgi:hypothetical protein